MWYEVTRTRVVTEVTHVKAGSESDALRACSQEKDWLRVEEEVTMCTASQVPEPIIPRKGT